MKKSVLSRLTLLSSLFVLALPLACSAAGDDLEEDEPKGATGDGDSTTGSGGSGAGAGDAVGTESGGGTSTGAGGMNESGTGGAAIGTGGSDGTGGGAAATGGSTGGGTDDCTPGAAGYDTSNADYVIDTASCIFYQIVATPVQKLSQADAITACEALSLGGFDDWKMPTFDELVAINVPKQQPAVDTAIFPNTDPSYYFTSEKSGSKAVVVDFNWNGGKFEAGPDGGQAYRCVRKSL